MKNLFLLISLLSAISLCAQNPEWKYYSEANSILSFAQEGDNMWAGTFAGLLKINRVTGERTIFDKTNAPLSDSWISKIAIGPDGTKWISTWSTGSLMKFDNSNWTTYNSTNSPLTGYSIAALDVDPSNTVWMATSFINSGLYSFNGVDWTNYSTSNSGIPSDYVTAIFCDGNIVWTGFPEVLAKFDGTNWVVFNENNSGFSGDFILDIKKDHAGNLWLLHYTSIEKFDGNQFTLYDNSNSNMPNNQLTSIAVDGNNTIWAGCVTYTSTSQVLGGLMSFDETNWIKYDTSNSDIGAINVSPVYVDENNAVWYGCSGLGKIGCKNGQSWTIYDASTAEMSEGYVRQIVHDHHGKAYIGGFDHNQIQSNSELLQFDWLSWTSLPNYTSETYTMATNEQDNLYLKDKYGVKKFDGTAWSDLPGTPLLNAPLIDNSEFSVLVPDHSGGLWMDYASSVETIYDPQTGTFYYHVHEGLAHFDGNSWTLYTSSNSQLPDAWITQVSIDKQNNVWIGTSQGLLKFDGVAWTTFTPANSSIPTSYISSFAIDTAGNIWLPDGHYGLYRFDLVNTVRYPHPTLSEYSSSGTILPEENGSIWLETLFDVIRFDGTDYTTFNAGNSPIPNDSNTTSLSIDCYGNKWIGTQFGFLVYRENGVITSSESVRSNHSSVRVSPNPFSDSFDVWLAQTAYDADFILYDMQLRPVFSEKISNSNHIRIQRNKLPSGAYLYMIRSGNKTVTTGKIIAE